MTTCCLSPIGKGSGAQGLLDAKAKKRQRQESDEEESRCTVSDNEMTTGRLLSVSSPLPVSSPNC